LIDRVQAGGNTATGAIVLPLQITATPSAPGSQRSLKSADLDSTRDITRRRHRY